MSIPDKIYVDVFEERKRKEYLIDKLGKIHRYENEFDGDVNKCLHYEIAHRLFPDIEYPEDYVYNIGWVIVGSHSGLSSKYPLNQAQLNTLDKIGGKNAKGNISK